MSSNYFRQGARIGRENPDTWEKILSHLDVAFAQAQQPKIHVLTLEAEILEARQQQLIAEAEILKSTSDSIVLPSQLMGKLLLFIALILTTFSFVALKGCLDPFRLGLMNWAVAITATIATVISQHLAFDSLRKGRLILFSICIICLSVLAFGQVLIALIRSQLMQILLIGPALAVDTHDISLVGSNFGNDFYVRTSRLLRIGLPMFSLGAELIAGLCLTSGLERLLHPLARLQRNLKKVGERLMHIRADLKHYELERRIFSEEFTAGAIKVTTQLKTNPEKRAAIIVAIVGLILLLVFIFCATTMAAGQQSSSISGTTAIVNNVGQQSSFASSCNVIALLDFSQSRKFTDHTRLSEFTKDVEFIEKIILRLSPGSKLTIFAITNASFSKPQIVFETGIVATDPGYFQEKLLRER
jgi:hypothetical protein